MLKQPFTINNFLTPPSTELSHFLMAENQLKIANGIDLTYKKGVVIKDLGYSKVGTTLQANKFITGLHNFRQSRTVQKMLATVNNSGDTALTLKYNNAGTWTDINVGSTYDAYEDVLVEMEDFIGYCFIVGYDAVDDVYLPSASLTGTTFSTSTNVTSMPRGKFVKRYRDRIYVLNAYNGGAQPYRTYYSGVPVAGAITWTPASNFFDVDFSEDITGAGTNWDKLMVFTEFSCYAWDFDTKKKVWDTGCINHRTIQTIDAYMIWADKYNIYASTSGRPTPIGNDIKELLANANPTAWRSAVVGNRYNLYLGNTSANGLSYANCMATFDVDLGIWTWRELYDGLTALAKFTTSGDDYLYMGANDGDVHVKAKWTDTSPVFSDDGNSIKAQFRTKAFDFGDPSIDTTVSKFITYAENGQGLMARFRIFNDNQEVVMPFTDIGKLYKVINTFDKKMTGRFIQFEFKEFSKNQPFKFYGFTAALNNDSKL